MNSEILKVLTDKIELNSDDTDSSVAAIDRYSDLQSFHNILRRHGSCYS